MKQISVLLLLFFCFYAKAQVNLVPNPSFEVYDTCPNNQGQIYYSTGWFKGGDSPDYFNSCDLTVPDFSVPYNWGGYQQPASGNAYCGIGTFLSGSFMTPNVREYVGTLLTTPLTIGTKYFVSLKVNTAYKDLVGNCATNNIGALFSTSQLNIPIQISTDFNPQINSTSIINDTASWVRIFGSFVADSAYKYIIIGNFFVDSNTDTLILNTENICYSYYYIDDICVSSDSTYTYSYNYDFINENDLTDLYVYTYPNPISDQLNIVNNSTETINIKITDINGKTILTSVLSPNSTHKVDTCIFSKGIYLIETKTNHQYKTKKIIKL